MGIYSKEMHGYFTSTGVPKFLNLPALPGLIEMWNLTEWGVNTDDLVNYAIGFANQPSGSAYAQIETGSAAVNNYALASGGFTFISAGTFQYGPTLTITGITQASAAVVTTSANHNLVSGNAVQIYGTTGMLQICGVYTITVLSPTTFSVPVNSSGFAAAASAGFCKQLLYPDLYIPEGTAITAVTKAASAVITTALNHSFVVGQEVYFVVPSQWGMAQLDSQYAINSNYNIPQQAYVTSVTANSITVNVNSTGFSTFAYPTSAAYALGVTPAQVFAIGDQNSGQTQIPPVTPPITIPGAFTANTRQGVIIGTGDGTAIMHANADVIRWRAQFPDLLITS